MNDTPPPAGRSSRRVRRDVERIHQQPWKQPFNRLAPLEVQELTDRTISWARGEITDAHRVYPGDGVAPLKGLLRDLRDLGFRGMLSLELFNREYWKQDALTVARTGLDKMRRLVLDCHLSLVTCHE